MTVAASRDARVRPVLPQPFRHVLNDGPRLRALRRARRAQNGRDRRAARHMIDVHRRKAALVVMRVQNASCWPPCAAQNVSSIWRISSLPGFHGCAELIKENRSKPRCLGLARCILQATDGRLRGQRFPALRTAADRDLHQRIVPQPVEVDRILVPAGDRRGAAITISNIACWMRSGSRRSGIASASRRYTPSLRSDSRSSNRPASEDCVPPSKSTVPEAGAYRRPS
jgi:hypothetical protein